MPHLAQDSATTPTTCTDAAQAIWDLLDGRLHGMREAELRGHLTTCARCLRYAEFQRRVLDAVRIRRVSTRCRERRERLLAALRSEGFVSRLG